MIKLSKKLYDKIAKTAICNTDEEICGLIGGIVLDGVRVVKEIYFLENTDHSKVHFSMDLKEQFDAVRDMRSKGLVPLGNFHSHINTSPKPSLEDKRLAYDEEASYLIVSLENIHAPVIKAFRIIDGVSIEEDIIIED